MNAKTKEPTYIIPMSVDMMEKLRGLCIFTELDLKNGYHHIEMVDESQKVLGFTRPNGKKCIMKRMCFGAKGAGPHFQKSVERATEGVPIRGALCRYIDNLLVGSEYEEEHIKDVVALIQQLTKWGFRLRMAKCKIGYRVIQFMGSMFDGKRRGLDKFKASTFQKFKRPRSGKDVQSILGFANFLRDFIPLYACVVGPLEKLRKCEKISDKMWRGEPERAFETLKKLLSSPLVLHLPRWDLPFQIETDASQYGVGGVLFQLVDGKKIAYVEFAAKVLRGGQCNYPAVKRELLSGMFCFKKW